MTLRKITTDNSVKYIPQSEQTQERGSKTNTRKNFPFTRKQNKNLSRKNKNSNKNVKAKGISIIKCITVCCF